MAQQVVVARKYDPYTGKWSDVYGPAPSTGGSSGGSTAVKPKTEPVSNPVTPPKPTTPDKGNSHQGSGEDNKDIVTEKTREITDYDLEGTAEIRPVLSLNARQMIDFQGLGVNFSGKYFMSAITHTINRSGYSMGVEVLRNGFVWKTSVTQPPKPTPVPAPVKVTPKPAPAPAVRYYTIKKGDTLWAIAKRYYGNGAQYPKIFNANRGIIKDAHWIYPGQRIVIP